MEAGTERHILCSGEILYGFLPAAPGAVGTLRAAFRRPALRRRRRGGERHAPARRGGGVSGVARLTCAPADGAPRFRAGTFGMERVEEEA